MSATPLIVPWARVPYLASHLLGRMSRQLSADWQRVYGHPVHLTETFVDTERNQATCYRAASWTELDLTEHPLAAAQGDNTSPVINYPRSQEAI